MKAWVANLTLILCVSERAGGRSVSAGGARRGRVRHVFRPGDFEPAANRHECAAARGRVRGADGGMDMTMGRETFQKSNEGVPS